MSKEINEEMNRIDDGKFISDMFESDGLETPDSLSKESVMEMLEKAPEKDESVEVAPEKNAAQDAKKPELNVVKKRTWLKPLGMVAAAAACFMLVLMPILDKAKGVPDELTTFKSYGEINKVIDAITEPQKGVLYEDETSDFSDGSRMTVKGASPEIAYDAASNADAIGSSGGSHSDTYIQVEGVDEADRVKVDDRYLYYINRSGKRIVIAEANKGKTKRTAVIKAGKFAEFRDLFLSGDRLVAVSSVNKNWASTDTYVKVFDISDRENPVQTAGYLQSGAPVSQRMVGDIVYVVSDKWTYERFIPVCGKEGKAEKLAPSDICCIPNPSTAEYTVIGAVDVSSGKEIKHVTKAVLGGSQDIYANGENLYIAGATIVGGEKKGGMYLVGGDLATEMIKVRMKDGDVKILKAATVEGEIDDQFSMDEKGGYFRIATTSFDDAGDESNNLFVMDKNLKVTGKVSGFAKGESIRAVRYIKDKAYVITYEETDPLFVIDLSDVSKPVIEGEVKISGFSTLLVPVAEDRLLGIGYSTEDGEDIDMEVTNGLKFALFDVSDPSSPKVLHSKSIKGASSEVQEDHRALVKLGDTEYLLPCNITPDLDWDKIWEKDLSDEEFEKYDKLFEGTGAVVPVKVKGDKISLGDFYKSEKHIDRCPVIDGYIYAIAEDGSIVSFKLR